MSFNSLFTTLMRAALPVGLLLSTQGFTQPSGGDVQTDVKPENAAVPAESQTAPAKAIPPNTETATRFVPTEKIPADDAVAFPVDI